jgi:3-phosphoshikimate 1-carboxyvinyltransferase
MRAALQFGSKCEVQPDRWIVQGPKKGLQVPDDVIDVGNSGTTLYFMAAVASLLPDAVVFTGDASIRRRPSEPLLRALRQLGVEAFTTRSNSQTAPFLVRGPMRSGTTTVSGLTSQWTSALLIAAPMCEGKTRIELPEPREMPYIEMTIDWMRKCGVSVSYDEQNFTWYEVEGNQRYKAFDRLIPSDWSSVGYPLVAALTDGSEVVIENLNFGDKQAISRFWIT